MGRRPTGRVTIDDVARAAQVSVSTVSRVIRDHPDVQSETRAAVLATIDSLGYRPSSIARALVSGETRLLALLVSDFTNPFYPQLAKSIEEEADRAGYMVVICNTRDRTADARRQLTRLLGQGLDGVIHASVGRDEEAVLSVLGDVWRVVFTNRPPRSRSVSYVVSGNADGAAELTRHLLSLGHQRIGFVGGPPYARNATERLR
ncbi:MAG: LacI family DNA-binding transcriptional regulator, partial [Dehalococcoidia bacterium]